MVKESGERLFSDLLCTDDGVLFSLLRDKGLSEMEAAVTIDRFIFEVRHELEEYGYCRLGDIGTLRIDPETKVLRLNPPVYGEALPKEQGPYVPEFEGEGEEKPIAEPKPKEEGVVEPSQKPKQPKPKRKRPRKGADWVIILAVIALIAALLSVGYGFYVSSLGKEDFAVDDEAMSELRMTLPEGEIGKE